MQRFADQVAIITGGADGLGRSIAARLSNEGAAVAIFDFNEVKMAEVKAELEAAGRRVATLKVDISDEDAVRQAIEQVVEQFGRLDITINCAGIVGPTGKKLQDIEGADFDKVIAINLRGSFNMTKYSLPHMLKNNYGRILLIASIAGKEGNAGMCAYSTSKAGVIGLTKSVGKEYAETGITVNALAPAVIRTAMVEGMPAEQVKYMTDKIPMKRCGALDEVASTAAFIVSKEASFNTGFCFDLTGGRAVY
ncbi:uncharacterized protein MONBRDRAFT_19102 [Monosiga brevicollis MX1]|uniref:Ketoreductase domain-containing protein n=1 Tax=Monosiga brevicollis TaxID=81824 RepID=A9UPE4_MONBE|nr:uncharacterized protein MONBRDRAFT_19102 [Monosiga brevicollis MX1]EDQ92405.1 predicted protein [Monosiga brevicollis MX1]|eukprot:XP_001742167.1 hypothetical protein [Monosiga brevicollis MX1]